MSIMLKRVREMRMTDKCEHKYTYLQPMASTKRIYKYCTSCRKCLGYGDTEEAQELVGQPVKYDHTGWTFGDVKNVEKLMKGDVKIG